MDVLAVSSGNFAADDDTGRAGGKVNNARHTDVNDSKLAGTPAATHRCRTETQQIDASHRRVASRAGEFA
jgi:hypothetical protein